MRRLLYIAVLLMLMAACGKKVSPDVAPEIQAQEIARTSTPEKAASKLIGWLVNADTARREFSRQLSSGILLYYDTIGSPDSARRFVTAFDSLSLSLSPAKQARLLLAMNPPAKVAYLVVRRGSNETIINEIEALLSYNQNLSAEFSSALEAARKNLKVLENENRESLRSDD